MKPIILIDNHSFGYQNDGTIEWNYWAHFEEEIPAIEQDNNKGGKIPVCLIPTLWTSDNIAKARRSRFEVK